MPPENHNLKRRDWLIAIILASAALSILVSTTQVGFPRDEGFYFRFSSIYQGWFSELWHGDDEAFEQERIDAVWKNNREHPPLAKSLFGISWANLTEKRRPVQRVERSRNQAEKDWIHITGLRKSEGFREGESVLILRPRNVEHKTGRTVERVIARAKIDAVRSGRVRARIEEGGLSSKTFKLFCNGRYGPPGAWSGCEAILESDLGKLEETTGFRLPTMIWFSLLVASLYLFGVVTIGRWGGIFAALALCCVPRHFYHAHLATFDVPVMTMIFWLVVSFWFSLQSRKWAVLSGILFGFALLTKLNAFFIPVVLGLWWLSHFQKRDKDVSGKWKLGNFTLPSMPLSFVMMILIGLPLFVGLWPRLWFDGWDRFLEYVRFHMHHEHYMQNYFGEVLSYPPFPVSFPFGMTLFTVPPVILLLSVIGGIALLRNLWKRGWAQRGTFNFEEFIGIHALFPIVLIALPSTPVFGGVKHWMTAMPFLCLMGGLAFQKFVVPFSRSFGSSFVGRIVTPLALILCLAQGAYATMWIHPEGTAYYNNLIGGLPGAADASMQRQFWGGQTRQGLDFLNENVPRGGKVYFHKSSRGCWDLYRKEGLLRADIQHFADYHDFNKIEEKLSKTTHAVYHHQKSHDDYELAIWRAYGTEHPVFQYAVDGVPLLSIYENPALKKERKGLEKMRDELRKRKPKRPGLSRRKQSRSPQKAAPSKKK